MGIIVAKGHLYVGKYFRRDGLSSCSRRQFFLSEILFICFSVETKFTSTEKFPAENCVDGNGPVEGKEDPPDRKKFRRKNVRTGTRPDEKAPEGNDCEKLQWKNVSMKKAPMEENPY